MEKCTENVVDWYTGDKEISVTLSNRKHVTKIKKLKEKYPDDFSVYHENPDGSIFCKVPLEWLSIRHPKVVQLTEEQKIERAERMRTALKNKSKN